MDESSKTSDNVFDAARSEGDSRTIDDMLDSVMQAVMMSMTLTDAKGPYTHDHYDRAMYDLSRLVALAKQAAPVQPS